MIETKLGERDLRVRFEWWGHYWKWLVLRKVMVQRDDIKELKEPDAEASFLLPVKL